MRNRIFWVTLGCFILVVVPILAPIALAAPIPKPPIKIGWLQPMTGFTSAAGIDANDAARLYFDKIGWKIAGREVKLILEDTKGVPDTGLMKAKKLVEADKVHLLAGIVMSNVAYAVRDYVHGQKVPLVITNASAGELTYGKQKSPYVFRIGYSGQQNAAPMGPYAYLELGFRKAIVFTVDMVNGYQNAAGFMDNFKACGGKIIQEIYFPVPTPDFASYIAKMRVREADCLWVFMYAGDSQRFSRQYVEYGVKIPIIGEGSYSDEMYLPGMEPDGAIGAITSDHWARTIERPENREFVEGFRAKYGRGASKQAVQGFIVAMVIHHALEAINGDAEDTPMVLKALREVSFEEPRAKFGFDKNQGVINDVYFRRTEKIKEELVNVPVAVLHKVVAPYVYSAEHWKANFEKLR